jgi:hypothetical protein
MNNGRTSSYDLAVAYRVYPGLSAAAQGFGLSKFELTALCLRSFRDSLGSLRAKIWAILDGCPGEYAELFTSTFEAGDLEILRLDRAGNGQTFRTQLEILTSQRDAELVYLAEDDYLYRPGAFRAMVDFVRSQESRSFVSPYDHPDHYRLAIDRPATPVRPAADQYWRSASTTCLTFLTRRSTLSSAETVFRSYVRRNYDASIWLALTKHRVFDPVGIGRLLMAGPVERRVIAKAWLYSWRQILFGPKYQVWTPLPSVATHMDSRGLAPAVDWQGLILAYRAAGRTGQGGPNS